MGCVVYYTFVTAYTNFVLDDTGLQLGVLLQILLSFTLIFHLWSLMIDGNCGMLNLKNCVGALLFNFCFYVYTFKTNKNQVYRYKT